MKWPPQKSWTRIKAYKGLHHFVAINYGGASKERYVVLVSVLDSKSLLNVSWKDLIDSSKWIKGWHRENLFIGNEVDSFYLNEENNFDKGTCLHPSEDSGLTIPISNEKLREWD